MPPPPLPRNVETRDTNGRLTAQQKGKSREPSPNGVRSASASIHATSPNEQDFSRKYGLEPKPVFDTERAEELCGIEEGDYESSVFDHCRSLALRSIIAVADRTIESHAGRSGDDLGPSLVPSRMASTTQRCPITRLGHIVRLSSVLHEAQVGLLTFFFGSNGMISELIANAAKVKSAQTAGSGGVFRRGSTRPRPQSASGNVTPRRVDSPSMR